MKTLDDIRLSPKDRSATQAAAAVLREKFPIEQIILFGSKARGDDDAESDIDLLVLTRDTMTSPETDAIPRVLFDLELEHHVLFSALVLRTGEWHEGVYQVLPIRREVERGGVAA